MQQSGSCVSEQFTASYPMCSQTWRQSILPSKVGAPEDHSLQVEEGSPAPFYLSSFFGIISGSSLFSDSLSLSLPTLQVPISKSSLAVACRDLRSPATRPMGDLPQLPIAPPELHPHILYCGTGAGKCSSLSLVCSGSLGFVSGQVPS